MCPLQHAAHFERIRVWKEAQVHAIQEKTEGRDRKVYPLSDYRGTSLIRNSAPLGPYSRAMPRVIWWS